MELKSKNIQSLANALTGTAKIAKTVFDNQKFYNNRIAVLDYIEHVNGLQTAIVTMHVVKNTFTYEFSFDLLYKVDGGKVLQQSRFYVIDLSTNGYVPQYIFDEVRKNKSAEIKFSFDDLTKFYNEKDIKIDDESSFENILDLCRKNNIASIKMFDRVFYTRVVCYDSNGTETGCIHVASISKLPANIQSTLYPCGECTYTI